MRITDLLTSGKVLRRMLLGVAVLCLVLGALALNSLRDSRGGAPSAPVNYHEVLSALATSTQPGGGANGWPELAAALEEFSEILESDIEGIDANADVLRSIRRFDRVRMGPYEPHLPDPERQLIDLVRSSGVLDRIDAALSKPRVVREDYGDPSVMIMNILLPELPQSRDLARLNAALMRIAAQDGDGETFIAAIERNLRLAQAISREPLFLSHLVALSIGSLTLSEIGWTLQEATLGDEILAAAMRSIEAHAALSDISLAVAGERLMVLDTIQRCHTDDGHGSGIFLGEVFFEEVSDDFEPLYRAMQAVGEECPTRRQTTQMAQDHFDSVVRYVTSSRLERAAADGYPSDAVETLGRNHFLLMSILTPIDRGVWSYDQYDMTVAATRIMLALDRYHRTFGDFPDRIESLVPTFMAELPVDPLSGSGFGYVKRAPTGSDSHPYWLYSFGVDGIDNAGRDVGENESARVLRPQPGEPSGLDYIVNRSRPARQ